jgi:N-acetylneuraminic acid mutarotase
VLTAGALALLGVQAPLAQAATHTSPGTAKTAVEKDANPTDVEPVCSDPAPGQYSCMALRRTDIKQTKGLRTTGDPAGLGAADLQDAYGLPADGGEGQTIAIVDAYDDPTAEEDLAVYRAQYGLPPCTTDNGCFTKVDQRGGTDYPTPDSGWAGEISLDLDMVSAAAPEAHILLVEADSAYGDDLGAAVDTAVALGAKYVSNSYGTGYDSGSGEAPFQLTDTHYNHPGVVITASSGDDAYGVSYPAASPYVTSVGGTSLVKDDSARGWSESVWYDAGNHWGPGSGCSVQQPKPAFQTDTGCDTRAVADVSAVADPDTGPAVYQTYGGSGWNVIGGTSAAAPLIAGVYAAAGTPVADTYPNSYPYHNAAGLNDVTKGANGTCTPDYLCTAGPGYDGPTGLGTPNGLAAFRTGAQGRLSGTITDAGTGAPVANASVTLGDFRVRTDAKGGYLLRVPVGSYDLTVTAYGYDTYRASGIGIADGAELTRDVSLTAMPSQTITGKVTDGSGHHWPLYAKITADGVPGDGVWTDPATGKYTLRLPDGADYTLRVAVAYPGYEPATAKVSLDGTAVKKNLAVPADMWAADAAGYELKLTGDTEGFDSTDAAPQGWTVSNTDASDGGWGFDDPGHVGNDTGGSGSFASVFDDQRGAMDTSLISPVFDLTGKKSPELSFQSTYRAFGGQKAYVDVTTDGGSTWKTLYTPEDTRDHQKIELPLSEFAGSPSVQVRFHYVSTGNGWWWSVDDVFVGERSLTPVPGGLVTGAVTDANTGDGVTGATVTTSSGDVTSAATPEDPALPDGFFWAFSDSGEQELTAAKPLYAKSAKSVNVAADATTRAALSLKAGKVSVTGGPLTATVGWGKQTTRTLTVTNTGTAPATVQLHEEPGNVTPAAKGAPAHRVKADFTHHALRPGKSRSRTAAAQSPSAAGDAWTAVPDLPVATEGSAVDSLYGKVYSGFGVTDTAFSTDVYRYDPTAGSWQKLASGVTPREAPAHGFIGGKWYVSGGWGPSGPVASTEVYDPQANTWSTAAANPAPTLGAGTAVLGGKLYAVGGCTSEACSSDTVEVYDPSTDSWSRAADYPVPVSWAGCGAIAGKLYCAGGGTDNHDWDATYVYDPADNAWSQLAALPDPVWGAHTTVANGRLLLAGGVINGFVVNQVVAFDPGAGTWSALPNMNDATARGGAAPGLYRVGGLGVYGVPVAGVEFLPGWDQTDAADISWMSEAKDKVTVAPGESVKVTVTLDASALQTDQPGTYQGRLTFTTDTPYTVGTVPVALTVQPPASWGKLSGTVLGKTASGTAPLAGATVQITSWASSYTLTTKADGSYTLWLDARNSPLTVIVAKDGYQPTVATVKIKKGQSAVRDFTLNKA